MYPDRYAYSMSTTPQPPAPRDYPRPLIESIPELTAAGRQRLLWLRWLVETGRLPEQAR